jgi:glycosyltransferase involved in cell wall biosynthesis
LRLLIISQYYWPETFRVNDIVADLSARGHQVTVLTGVPNYPQGDIFPAFRKNPAAFDTHAGAKIIRIPMLVRGKGTLRLGLNYLSFVLSGMLVGTWRLRGMDFDAIFVFEVSPITVALPAILLRRLKRAPILLWILDLWPETLAAVGAVRSPVILSWVGRLVSFIYSHCDRLLIQSNAFQANLETFGADPHKTRYFPAWAEPILNGPLEEIPPAEEMAPFEGTFKILFAGNIGEAQDFPAILDAAETLGHRRDIRWILVGDGRAAEGVQAEIKRRGLDESVFMLGRHSVERMPSFFRAAGALLVSLKRNPIFSMTIPGKVQTYLAAGVPILGMLDGEGARVILAAEAGFVSPAGDGKALAHQVERLVNASQATRDEMGRKAQEYCKRHFDRGTLISSLEKWCAELIEERATPPPKQD